MSLKNIDKNIRAITTSAAKLNMLIHTTAMMVAAHAQEHGDCTRALSLVKAMPASMRRTMLVLWFNTYTPIRVIDKNDKVGILKETAKGYTPFDLEAGNQTPFFDLAEQNPETGVLDFDKLVALVARLGKTIDKRIDDGKVADEDVESAKAISRTLAGLRFDRVKAANEDEAFGPAPLAAVG
jgi:class 3 adenylate cyclase